MRHPFPSGQQGVSMIEVLVTIVIVSLSLLGLAGLQSRMTIAQMEAYQRAEAIILLDDMANRLRANSALAGAIATAAAGGVGTGDSRNDCSALTGANLELCEWSNLLKGTTERTSGGSNAGAAIGMRGCIDALGGTPAVYRISVAWQGMAKSFVPSGLNCGSGQFGLETLGLRRVISQQVSFPNLSGT